MDDTTEQHSKADPGTIDQGESVVAEFLGRVSALDLEGALALVTDDWTLEIPFRGDGGPRSLRGEEASNFFRQASRMLTRMDLYDVVIHARADTGWIAAEYKSNGITTDGRPYRNRYAGFFDVRGGRVAAMREYFDPTVVTGAWGPTKRT